jgi:hypothetical protein
MAAHCLVAGHVTCSTPIELMTVSVRCVATVTQVMQAITCVNSILSFLVSVHHGVHLTAGLPSHRREDLIEQLEGKTLDAQHVAAVVSFISSELPTLLNLLLDRACLLPYADKTSTATFLHSFCLLYPNGLAHVCATLLERFAPQTLLAPAQTMGAAMPQHDASDMGSHTAAISSPRPVIRDAVLHLVEPLQQLLELERPPQGSARRTYKEELDARLNEFFVRFSDIQ